MNSVVTLHDDRAADSAERASASHALGMESRLRLLRPAEVAGALQVSRRLVYALIARGHLKPCRIGGTIRVHPQDLANYVASLRGVSPRQLDTQPVANGASAG